MQSSHNLRPYQQLLEEIQSICHRIPIKDGHIIGKTLLQMAGILIKSDEHIFVQELEGDECFIGLNIDDQLFDKFLAHYQQPHYESLNAMQTSSENNYGKILIGVSMDISELAKIVVPQIRKYPKEKQAFFDYYQKVDSNAQFLSEMTRFAPTPYSKIERHFKYEMTNSDCFEESLYGAVLKYWFLGMILPQILSEITNSTSPFFSIICEYLHPAICTDSEYSITDIEKFYSTVNFHNGVEGPYRRRSYFEYIKFNNNFAPKPQLMFAEYFERCLPGSVTKQDNKEYYSSHVGIEMNNIKVPARLFAHPLIIEDYKDQNNRKLYRNHMQMQFIKRMKEIMTIAVENFQSCSSYRKLIDILVDIIKTLQKKGSLDSLDLSRSKEKIEVILEAIKTESMQQDAENSYANSQRLFAHSSKEVNLDILDKFTKSINSIMSDFDKLLTSDQPIVPYNSELASFLKGYKLG